MLKFIKIYWNVNWIYFILIYSMLKGLDIGFEIDSNFFI